MSQLIISLKAYPLVITLMLPLKGCCINVSLQSSVNLIYDVSYKPSKLFNNYYLLTSIEPVTDAQDIN